MKIWLALLTGLMMLCLGGCANLPRASLPSGAINNQRTTIVFWNENAAADRTKYYQELIARFEKENPDIHVEYVGLPKKAARLKINTAIATNELPDVCGVQSAWIAEFCHKGVLLNVDPWFEKWEGKTDLLPKVVADNRRLAPDGGLYQMPNTMGMEILWYRQDWFAEKQLATPKSWDDFFYVISQIDDKKNNRYGFSLRGGDGSVLQLMRAMFAYSGETRFFAADGHCVLRDPIYVPFVKRYLGLYRNYTATSDITNGYQEMIAAFDTNQAALMQHNIGSYGNHQAALQEDQFAALLLPESIKGTMVQEGYNVDGYGIFNTTKHPEAAWRFVSFLCSAEVQSWWNERIGQIPVSQQALNADWVMKKPHMRLVIEALKSEKMKFYMPPMYLPDYRKIIDGSDRYIEEVLLGNMTVEEFLNRLAEKFETAQRSYDQSK